MAHLLVIELPGGNDFDILDAAFARGDDVTFLTSDLAVYRANEAVSERLRRVAACLEIPGFSEAEVEAVVMARHAQHPFDAVLCIVDIRVVAAARLARLLGVKGLAEETARLLRDKFSVRRRLDERGVEPSRFALASTRDEMQAAIEAIGYPAVIKPSDGYASQNVVLIEGPEDLEPWISPLDDLAANATDYGLGVRSNLRYLIEPYLIGAFIGCDVMSVDGEHHFLGVNEKVMAPPPSFAIEGGCFTPARHGWDDIKAYAFRLLDAVGFNYGASHIEMMLTKDGPRLIEINPRIVSAKIPRLMSLAYGRDLYRDLISLHLGQTDFLQMDRPERFAVSRWLMADREGVLDHVDAPNLDKGSGFFEILKKPGDHLRPPFENVDRIGYVMTCADTREEAELLATRWIAGAALHYRRPERAGDG